MRGQFYERLVDEVRVSNSCLSRNQMHINPDKGVLYCAGCEHMHTNAISFLLISLIRPELFVMTTQSALNRTASPTDAFLFLFLKHQDFALSCSQQISALC